MTDRMQFCCRCGFLTPDLGAFLEHQGDAHQDGRWGGAVPSRAAEVREAEAARQRQRRERERAATALADALARARATARARADPASVEAVEASVAYHATQIELVHRLARRRALERQAAQQAGE